MSERMSLLEFLKERSGIRLSKLEAYLDLVDKASVQYIPKDLCKQEFSLSNGQFVITITELAGCWHWHRATVRTFIEQLEKMNQISVTRLTKSQIITIPMLAETPAVSPIDAALDVFRQKMCTALDEWRSGKMSASACASECEQLYEESRQWQFNWQGAMRKKHSRICRTRLLYDCTHSCLRSHLPSGAFAGNR